MIHRSISTMVAVVALAVAGSPAPVRAENPMGYRLLSEREASSLPRGQGAVGLDVERSQQITDSGMTFDVMRVRQVRRGSPAAAAGLQPGDQIIAVDGRVFPTIAAFAAYVGSLRPESRAVVDYIPLGGGPGQAQRLAVTVGVPGRTAPQGGGLSTGSKVAIGVGAAALLGCYELGCFSHRQQGPQPGYQTH